MNHVKLISMLSATACVGALVLTVSAADASAAMPRTSVTVDACADGAECKSETGWLCLVAIPGGWNVNPNCKPRTGETLTSGEGAECVLGFGPDDVIPEELQREIDLGNLIAK